MRWWVLAAGLALLVAAESASAAAPRFVRNIDDRRDRAGSRRRALVDVDRRPQAGDRRAVLQHVRLRPTRAAARQGHGDRGARLRARRGRRPRRRRRQGDRRRRQRGHGGGVRPQRRRLRSSGGASTCSGGQCPETRGMAAGDLDRDGRIEVVATTTNTSHDGSQVFVFDAAGNVGARMAPLQRLGRGLQRHREPRLRRLRRERRHRTSWTATRSSRSSSRSTTTRSTCSTTTGRRCSRRRGSRTATSPRRAAGLGTVHPLAEPEGRGRPLSPARRRVAASEPAGVAAVDGFAALDRRPRPRRPQRGDRPAERREARAVRDAGLRVHGARRREAAAARRAGTRGSGGCR